MTSQILKFENVEKKDVEKKWSFFIKWQNSFHSKAVVWMYSAKNVFLQISQNSQENTCVKVPFLIDF